MDLPRYRWTAPPNFGEVVQRIVDAASDEAKLNEIFRILVAYQPLLNYRFSRGSIFWRGRPATSETGFAFSKEIGPPPPSITAAGRLNDRGKPVLYAATRMHTVFTELDVADGDYIHIVGLRLKPNQGFHIMAVGELCHIFKTGRSRILGDAVSASLNRMLNDTDPAFGRRLVYVDALLDSYLADANARDNNYLHTRPIAAAIFKKIESIKAFFYPSVRHEAGMNFAVEADTYERKMHVTCSQVVRVLRRQSVGLYDYEVCRHAKELVNKGNSNGRLTKS